jgi:hypothetical protein
VLSALPGLCVRHVVSAQGSGDNRPPGRFLVGLGTCAGAMLDLPTPATGTRQLNRAGQERDAVPVCGLKKSGVDRRPVESVAAGPLL